MPIVWTDRHRLHVPNGEVWVGVRIPGTEVPERGEVIRDALEEAGGRFIEVNDHGPGPVLRVHDVSFVEYLETAHARWLASGLPEDPGQDRVVPYVFPLPQLMGGRALRKPVSASALAGLFAMDTTSLIGPGTYEAARAAVDVALTAADCVLDGERAAYAACRPPGHHAGTGFYGGSCYLNNAAIAAQWLRDHGVGVVAILDLDAHHGNGTQEIFYGRRDVFYGSIHVDPGHGWFPHFVGFASETGDRAGARFNSNVPLPPGCGPGPWLKALETIIGGAAAIRPEVLVVSLGVDGWSGDPESPLAIDMEAFHRAGELVGAMGIPAIFVQEGGYDLDQLGRLIVTVLAGFEEEG